MCGSALLAPGEGTAVGSSRADHVRIATTDWCATNQAEYFGMTDLRFEAIAESSVKRAAAAALLTV